MFTVRTAQMASLEADARRRFVGELRASLAKKYPHCLPSFPAAVQERIVRNLLGRACRWGIRWQSALAAFAETSLAVAPNFDEHDEVGAGLRNPWLGPDRAMLTIRRWLPRAAWKQIETTAQDLPLFVPPKWIGASLLDRTAAAIPLALGDVLGEADARQLAETSLLMAENLNLDRFADAGLVLTARLLLYAEQLRERAELPWQAEVFDRQRPPREVIAMLKLRISLDHRRFI